MHPQQQEPSIRIRRRRTTTSLGSGTENITPCESQQIRDEHEQQQ